MLAISNGQVVAESLRLIKAARDRLAAEAPSIVYRPAFYRQSLALLS